MLKMQNLVSATRLSNYIRNDPIIDYLDTIDKNGMKICEKTLKMVKKEDGFTTTKTSFDYIVNDGYIFEEIIIKRIYEKMCKLKCIKLLKKIDGDLNFQRSDADKDIKFEALLKHYNDTKTIIQSKKYMIILNGLLIDEKKKTYGYPDIIANGKWIKMFIKNNNYDITDDIYYIIDIKSSTINIVKDCKYISSSLLYKGYKSQIYVYKQALDNIQKVNSKYGFIIGKKYKYIKNKEIHFINDPFDKMGFIDYDVEKNIKKNIFFAIKWNRNLSINWRKYKLSPASCKELMPNMKNPYDKNYKKIKKIISVKNGEITMLWNCGIKQRINALKNKCKNIYDKRLTPEILGFEKDTKKYTIIKKMLSMTKSTKKCIIPAKNNINNWRQRCKNEFYVDFETYNDEEFDSYTLEQKKSEKCLERQKLYMIGVGHVINNEYITKCFILHTENFELNKKRQKIEKLHCLNYNNISVEIDEKTLIQEFVKYIYSFKSIDVPNHEFIKNTRLIHWSFAEPSIFNKKILIHRLKLYNNLPWFDLIDVFKNPAHPIIIKDCYSFSLKDISKTMNAHNLIDINWSSLDDGLLSLFLARDLYREEGMEYNITTNTENVKNIIYYNWIDCRAMYLLLDYIRNNS